MINATRARAATNKADSRRGIGHRMERKEEQPVRMGKPATDPCEAICMPCGLHATSRGNLMGGQDYRHLAHIRLHHIGAIAKSLRQVYASGRRSGGEWNTLFLTPAPGFSSFRATRDLELHKR